MDNRGGAGPALNRDRDCDADPNNADVGEARTSGNPSLAPLRGALVFSLRMGCQDMTIARERGRQTARSSHYCWRRSEETRNSMRGCCRRLVVLRSKR